jgi:hypothetical protein
MNEHLKRLKAFLLANYPAYISGDDDLTTDEGMYYTIKMVLDRLRDDRRQA